MTIKQTFDSFDKLKIVVIGDVMIDSYMWGKVNRISPEAPIPIVSIQKKEERLGGAANVGLNIKSLGAEPILLSVIGDDIYGKIFFDLLQQSKISTKGIVVNSKRKTTIKTRVIGKNQHLLRVDEEDTSDISFDIENKLLEKLENIISEHKVDAIVFEDYNKGVLTKRMIQESIRIANESNIPTLVDPKQDNFFEYKDVTLFKPNFKEFIQGFKLDIEKDNYKTISNFANQYIKQNNIKSMLITLSENGILISYANKYSHFDALEIDIADVSGAGDTVISVAALCLASGLSFDKIAQISNIAGSLVCEKVGVVQVSKNQLLETVKSFGYE